MSSAKVNLSTRLKNAREIQKGKTDIEERQTHHGNRDRVLPPPWEKTGTFTFFRTVVHPSPLGITGNTGLLAPYGVSAEKAVFFDLETTGLSGGAGNVAFLSGFGKLSGGSFIVTQFFLADFPGEKEYLENILEYLESDCVYVSFNGKSFDSHFLQSKFLMHGLRFSFERQIDLLHLSRRLWKRHIGSCSLSNLEEHVLSITRENDVPGYLVPEHYFSFLRTGEVRELEPVFYHNEQDILSLAILFNRINLLLLEPFCEEKVDRYSLGRYMLEQADPAGERLLQEAISEGDLRAVRFLTVYLKREGRWKEAVSLWSKMWHEKKSVFCGTELAKYYEHREREIDKASDIVKRMLLLPFLTREVKDELKKRRRRLMRHMQK